MVLTGTHFTGDTEAGSGTSTGSASNVPVVTLQRLDNGAVSYLRPVEGFSPTNFKSASLMNLPQGLYAVRLMADGIPSVAKLVRIDSTGLPLAPSQFTPIAGNGQVLVSFAPLANGTFDHYEAVCSPRGGGAGVPFSDTRQFVYVSGLANGGSYRCSARGVNATGPGPWSNDSVVVTPVAVGMSMKLGANPSRTQLGQAVNVQATLTPANNVGTADGTVTVIADGQTCSFSLPAQSCQLTFNSKGYKQITASYSGGFYYSGAAASVNHSVGVSPDLTPILMLLLD